MQLPAKKYPIAINIYNNIIRNFYEFNEAKLSEFFLLLKQIFSL